RVLRDVDFDDLIAVQDAALTRILVVPGFGEISAGEAVDVQNDQRAVRQQRQVDLQRGGVERHQHVGRVARRRDRSGTEVDLIRRYTEGGAGGCADLGGKVWKRGKVVPRERRGRHDGVQLMGTQFVAAANCV